MLTLLLNFPHVSETWQVKITTKRQKLSSRVCKKIVLPLGKITKRFPVLKSKTKYQVKPRYVQCVMGSLFYSAKLWNQLPFEIRDIKNSDTFKAAIKK